MSQEFSELVDDILAAGPFADRSQAEGAVRATLTTLRQRLLDDESRLLEVELPEECADLLHEGHYEFDFDLAEFYRRVSAHEHMATGRGLEHSQIVCRTIARRLPASTLQRLRRHLPDFAELFQPPEPVWRPPLPEHPGRSDPPRRNLSEGRPGSQHPLSSARPQPGHSHSVAVSDDPHADTKLSSSRGLTQEREGETLADGKPKLS